ncbi:ISAs1 family transposase, partial [Muribaculum intestinale]
EKPVDGKTNELTVLPSVLSSLWLTGALVSVDAMGTHRNIAEQIILQGGDYLMALKDNQPILKGLTESIFSSTTPISVYTTEEKGHGRVEKRT